jgi:hypothetical protein
MWSDYWGTISISFLSQVYYYSTTDTQSDDPYTFCGQILDPTTTAKLGVDY